MLLCAALVDRTGYWTIIQFQLSSKQCEDKGKVQQSVGHVGVMVYQQYLLKMSSSHLSLPQVISPKNFFILLHNEAKREYFLYKCDNCILDQD